MAFFKKQSTNEVKLQKIEAGKIHAQLYFQNPPSEKNVKKIVDNFDWNNFQPLDVSYRDDKYNVVDGQNRLTAVIQKFGTKELIPCYVRYGLTEASEMELFVKLAKERRHVSPMEIFKAWYGCGNKLIVGMVDSIRDSGLIFDFKNGSGNGRISCPVTTMKIIEELGYEDFKRFITLLSESWNGNKFSLQKEFIDGMYIFFRNYLLEIDDERFIKTFKTTEKKEGKSVQIVKAKGLEFALKSQGVAQAVRFYYNKSIKSATNKLPEKVMR